MSLDWAERLIAGKFMADWRAPVRAESYPSRTLRPGVAHPDRSARLRPSPQRHGTVCPIKS